MTENPHRGNKHEEVSDEDNNMEDVQSTSSSDELVGINPRLVSLRDPFRPNPVSSNPGNYPTKKDLVLVKFYSCIKNIEVQFTRH